MEDYTTSHNDHTVNNWEELMKPLAEQAPFGEQNSEAAGPVEEAPENEPDNQEAGQEENEPDEVERLLERANLYRKFGKVALVLEAIEEARGEKSAAEFLRSGLDPVPKEKDQAEPGLPGEPSVKLETAEVERTPEEMQARALLNQLRMALEAVDKSLEVQKKLNIVFHKQINTAEALSDEMQKGTAIPELDIRFDKDGTPWISHSPRAGGRFWFSRLFGGKSAKPIHKMTTEEMKKVGGRQSLGDGLKMLAEYAKDNPNHFPVIELKELGPSTETSRLYLETVKKLLDENGFSDKAIFATLSPSVLRATHDIFPDNAKIFNGGIAPVISYNLAENTNKEKSGREISLKIPGMELHFSNATEVTERPDGYGKQTGYLWTRLPKETVETLRESKDKTGLGAASLTVVNKFADVLQIFSPRAAEAVRRHYRGEVEKLGLDIQAQISKRNMEKSARDVLKQMGEGTIIYSNKSHDWSEFNPDEDEKKAA